MLPQTETLALLRATLPAVERPLIGYEAMATYLGQIGWQTREGFPPSPHTVKLWARTRRFPVAFLPGHRKRVWTTTHAVTAWLLAGAGGLGVLWRRTGPKRLRGPRPAGATPRRPRVTAHERRRRMAVTAPAAGTARVPAAPTRPGP